MELRTYLAVLWRRKWVIAITVAVTLVVVVIGTLMMTPSYEAFSTIRIAIAAGGPVSYTDYMYAERLMNTYAELATSGPVLEELTQQFGGHAPLQIEVELIPNTELMRIVVEDVNPVLTAEATNALAEILVAHSRELYAGGSKAAHEILGEQLAQIEEELNRAQGEYENLVIEYPENAERIEAVGHSIRLKQETYATLLQQYENARATEAIRANALSIVEPATIPPTPSRPRKTLNVALGLMVGLMGGVGLAFLLENLDTRLHSAEQVADVTALRVLGRIPETRKSQTHVFLNGDAPQREAYRHLRTNIHSLAEVESFQTLLVTSAEPREGKSTIAANLASAIAQSDRQVVIVDADLRRPSLHTAFDLPNRIGLSSVLQAKFTHKEAVQYSKDSGVWVLTSGPLPYNPAELLSTPQMGTLIEDLAQRFDMILVDTPSLLAVTDAAVLAPKVDGVVLVVAYAQVSRPSVRSACRVLTDVHARPVGVVVNRMNRGIGRHYRQYYHEPDIGQRADPLTEIQGIGPVYEKALNAAGISSFAQLAEQDPKQLSEILGEQVSVERISRDQWIEQAQAFVRPWNHE